MGETVNRIGASNSLNKKDLKLQGNELLSKDINIFEDTCTGSTKPCVFVLDDFRTKTYDIDGNENTSEITHGEAVTSFAKSEFPKANFIKYNVDDPEDPGFFSNEKIVKGLKSILERIKDGQKIDAVNLSFSGDTKMPEEDDLATNRKNYKKSLDANAKQEVDLIEQIVKKGTPVFTAAGNREEGKKDLYNELSLAEGITTVSAKENDVGVRNSLVNNYEQGRFYVKITSSDKDKNITCFDFTEDGKADYCGPYVDPKEFSNTVEGTSHSTPKALGKYLKEKYKECE